MDQKPILFFIAVLILSGPSHSLAATSSTLVNTQAVVPLTLQLTLSPQSQSELKFGNIQPSSTQTTEAGPIQLAVKIDSNSGQKYQLTQTVSGPLQNSNGDTISEDNLLCKTSSSKPNATTVTVYTAVSGSSQTVYVSNNAGEGDTVVAEYKLIVPASQSAGDYATLLTYTASAI